MCVCIICEKAAGPPASSQPGLQEFAWLLVPASCTGSLAQPGECDHLVQWQQPRGGGKEGGRRREGEGGGRRGKEGEGRGEKEGRRGKGERREGGKEGEGRGEKEGRRGKGEGRRREGGKEGEGRGEEESGSELKDNTVD